MNDAILKQIKQLPPLPDTALRIEAVYQDPNSTFEDMVKILEKDPLLTADILKSANSPLYGFSREITSIAQAVSLFGMGTIRGFALASIISKSFDLDLSPYNISPSQYSRHSENQNALITGWYVRKNPKILGILSPAAFLVDIGKVLIARQLLSDNLVERFKELIAKDGDIKAAEEACVETSTAAVSAAIFDHWRFEEALIDTIRYSDTPSECDESIKQAVRSLYIIRTAIKLDGSISDESISAAKALVEHYALDMESFENALQNFQG